MPKQLIGEEIAKARNILAIQPLPPEHHENLQAQLCDLEYIYNHMSKLIMSVLPIYYVLLKLKSKLIIL